MNKLQYICSTLCRIPAVTVCRALAKPAHEPKSSARLRKPTQSIIGDWPWLSCSSSRVRAKPTATLNHAKAKHMAPSHLNSGTWLKDVGHSSSLTAQMVHGLTSHAPIGHYRKQFKVENQNESCPHCEGGPAETFRHVLFKCLRHPTRPSDMPNFTKATSYWEHFGKFTMDNLTAYVFVDGPAYSQTMDYRTRMVTRWAKDASTSMRSLKAKS